MTRNSISQQTNLITLREEYKAAFRMLATETSRLLSMLDFEPSNAVALMEARYRVDQANRSYREARNVLAAEMMRRQRRGGLADAEPAPGNTIQLLHVAP